MTNKLKKSPEVRKAAFELKNKLGLKNVEDALEIILFAGIATLKEAAKTQVGRPRLNKQTFTFKITLTDEN